MTNRLWYDVQSVDEARIVVQGRRGEVDLTPKEVGSYLRLSHAISIDSAQSKTLSGKVRVLESGHTHMSHARLLVAGSRATSSELLAVH